MNEPIDWAALDDDALSSLLTGALAEDLRIPEGARDGALAAFDFRDLDAALLELVSDSRVDELAGVRSTAVADAISLVWATAELEIAVDITGHRLVGQVIPAGATAGRLEAPGMAVKVLAIDDLGRFACDVPTDRPLRLVVHAPTGLVRTDWFRA